MAQKRTSNKTKKPTKRPSKKITKKTVTTKSTKAKPVIKQSSQSRQLKRPQYKTLRPSKRIKHPSPKLPVARKLFWRSLVNLFKYWKLFLGILIIYIILTLALVKGFSLSSNLPTVKKSLQSLSTSPSGQLNTGVTLFNFLLGTTGASSDVAAAYQSMLLIVISLAVIWALRQTQAGVKVRIRDAFYKGLYPLAPLILVIVVIALQTIPLLIANTLYSFIFGSSLAVTVLEKVLWGSLLFLFAVLTLYMVTSSIFALYIVTLPDVAPMQALRSARELVRYRRWTVMRKLLFLPLVLLVIGGLIVIPLILYLTPAAEVVYFFLSVLTLFIAHSYIYTLYRELLA